MERKFKIPPINELVIGLFFEREIPELRSEHVGLFWGRIREEFPIINQQMGISAPGAVMAPGMALEIGIGNVGEIFPMPRYWLENADKTFMMRIFKKECISIKLWAQAGSPAYPHFEIVR